MIFTQTKAKAKQVKKYKYYIGIDCGVNTGYAFWDADNKSFQSIQTLPIHSAMQVIKNVADEFTLVRVEDARKRKWFGNAGREQLQGAGSIKRDAKIWEDFLTDLKVDFELVAPKNNKTKLTSKSFQKITGYNGRTSEHARDAAMLVVGM